MDSVIRAVAIYVILVLVFRLSGKRTLEQITLFDFVLLLIVAESTQQALLGDDFSVTNGVLIVITLVAMDNMLAAVANRSARIDRLINDVPLVLIEDGELNDERIRRSRIAVDDIVAEARITQGLESLDEVRHAVLERNGRISVIPWRDRPTPDGPGTG